MSLTIDKNNINSKDLDNLIKCASIIDYRIDKIYDLSKYTHITKLEFYSDFNHCVDNMLPPNITHLIFGWKFNKPVNNLPNNIIELVFGFNFNQSVNNLPQTIKILKFIGHFNQSIDNLPQSLEILHLNSSFNKSIYNLPNTLLEIHLDTILFCDNYNINMLPDSIKIIKVNSNNINLRHKILTSKHRLKLKIGLI